MYGAYASWKIKERGKMRYWYGLTDEDIQTVADELEIKLSKSRMKKIKELAPDYIDWFSAIEMAINATSPKPKNTTTAGN